MAASFTDFKSSLLHPCKHSTHPGWLKQKEFRQLTECPGEPAGRLLSQEQRTCCPSTCSWQVLKLQTLAPHPHLTPPVLTTGLFSREGSSSQESRKVHPLCPIFASCKPPQNAMTLNCVKGLLLCKNLGHCCFKTKSLQTHLSSVS